MISCFSLVVSVQRDLAILLTEIQEFVIKKSNRVELMAMLGLFGAIVSGIQMYPLEFTHFIIFFNHILYSPPVRGNFFIIVSLTLQQ
jgi:hypothetical protein